MKAGLNKQDQVAIRKMIQDKIGAGKISKALNVELKVVEQWIKKATSGKKSESKIFSKKD